jgi:hypothetical protein
MFGTVIDDNFMELGTCVYTPIGSRMNRAIFGFSATILALFGVVPWICTKLCADLSFHFPL